MAMSFFSSNESSNAKVQKRDAISGAKYLRDRRFKDIAANNDSHFGGREDEKKRRFKKFAKRV
jgi:hypothetical protein